MRKVEQFFLLLLIYTIPIQLGKHFWPPFAYVDGIRVDYISPTLYFTDLIAVILIFLYLLECIVIKKRPKGLGVAMIIGVLVLVPYLQGIIIQNGAYLYGMIRLFEYFMIGIIASELMNRRLLGKMILGLSIISLAIVFLEILQFVRQESIGGILYWLGERHFSLSTPGIARFLSDGVPYLRPYSTFPHPNVLAWYLFFGFAWGLYKLQIVKKGMEKALFGGVVFVVLLGILLTFSRGIIFCSLLLLVLKSTDIKRFVMIFSASAVFLISFWDRFSLLALAEGISERTLHLASFFPEIANFPLFGSGLYQYFYVVNPFNQNITSYLNQPPHNTILLITIQTGVIGFTVFLWGVSRSVRRLVMAKKSYERETLLVFIFTFIFAGFFDHYHVTLHQAALICALIFGFCWSSIIEIKE